MRVAAGGMINNSPEKYPHIHYSAHPSIALYLFICVFVCLCIFEFMHFCVCAFVCLCIRVFVCLCIV